MALLAKPLDELIARDETGLRAYFDQYAAYIPDAPENGPHYGIRLGSTAYYSNDTLDLWNQFRLAVALARRRRAMRRKLDANNPK